MATYIVSSCFLKNAELRPYISDVLFRFPQQDNSLKVGIDKNKIIIDLYAEIAEEKHHVSTWLDLMSFNPTSFEKITEIEEGITEETEVFLFVCSALVNNKKMIVDTIQNFGAYNVTEENQIEYRNNKIKIIEKDDAVIELRPQNQQINIASGGSSIATGGSSIMENGIGYG
ncbi:hypothetical protein [Desulfobacter curvatus]|uniref:hypothetical protein n=1 Tax=Desulfobacter curvatus TaxID=2290 RepID=UPI00035E55DC|nr:hypothetical protein [Desulfobacter curvatus]